MSARPSPTAPAAKRRSDTPIKKLIPFLLFGAVALFIASREIPAVRDAFEQTFTPQKHQARWQCIDSAIALAATPEHARVIRQGTVHNTRSGFFVDDLVIGEMSEQGGENRFLVECYTDAQGSVIQSARRSPDRG